jgi:predicted MFS family arabinose efflux permease
LIALAGVWIAFAVNALSFAGVLAVLLWWRPEPSETQVHRGFRGALREGFLFVVGHRTLRNVLVGVMMFLVPATAMWSLLPLVARDHLGWQAAGFGLLVTSLGLGAVVAARSLHSLHRRLRLDRTVGLAMIVFAAGLWAVGMTRQVPLVLLAMFIMGGAWMLTLTTLNVSAQMTLPNALRARGMGSYMTVVAASMSLGALLWGQVAGQIGLVPTQWTAAATMLVTAALRFHFPIDEKE